MEKVMNRLKKYIQNKLYGKYYPVNEDTKDIFLEEQKNYFCVMIKKEQFYLLIRINLESSKCKIKYKNIIKNEEMMRFVTQKTASLREQVKNLEMIIDKLSGEEKDEITLDDIKYVYDLQYLRRKQELIKFIMQGCFLIGNIIFLYYFIKDRI